MLQILPKLQPCKLCSKKVRSFLAEFGGFSLTRCFFATSLESSESPLPSLASRTDEIGLDLSSVNFTAFAESVVPKCTRFLDSNWGDKSLNFTNLSPYNYYLTLSGISPEIIRRFWRVSVLKPQNVLEILLGFDCDSGDPNIEFKKIDALWGLFRWVSKQQIGNFEHLPQSCRIMVKMLVRMDLFEEAECLLSRLDGRAVLMDYTEIFDDLIVKYKNECAYQGAIMKHHHMRRLGLAPSFSSCLLVLELLVQMNEVYLAHQMYLDISKMGMGKNLAENKIHEDVMCLLCMNGKVHDARNLVKSSLNFGIRPSNLVVDAIVIGHCKKKDYKDIPSLFLELGISPNVVVGNKAILSLCKDFCAERGNLFRQEFEQLGFCPDEVTYGILIGQSCREGRLRTGFIYLSECLSRDLRPTIYSYNALMSGLFKEGMWKQSKDVLKEMDDSGVILNSSTFKVLLAGFVKARQFGEVKEIVIRMADRGLVHSSLLEDQLSIALKLLGLCPSDVKVRRDNDIKSSWTEFFDELGNGLYLDTDLDKLNKIIDKVLDDAMFPDFNSQLLEDLTNNDMNIALGIMDEMDQWGQELSLSTLSTLLPVLSSSRISIKTMIRILDKTSKSLDQLDQRTLNLLIQKYSKRGLTHRAKMIFDKVRKMQMEIENETYTTLFIGLCKKGNLKVLRNSWKFARESNWSPEPKNVEALLDRFCWPELLNVALELLEVILLKTSYRPLDAIRSLVEKFCSRGLTNAAYVLVDELAKLGLVLDEMTCSFLISGFLEEGRIAEVFMIFDVMMENNFVPPLNVLLQLIPQLGKHGNIEKAFVLQKICSRFQHSDLQLVTSALINVFLKCGRFGEASNLFQELLKMENLGDPESYNFLLQGYYQDNNNLNRGGEILGAMIRKNIGISISSYRKLMQKTCAAGKLSDALSLKELMLRESSVPEIVVYNILIFYLSASLARNNMILDTVIREIEKKGLQFDRVTYDFIIRGASYPHSLHYLEAMIAKGFKPSNRSLRSVIASLCCQGDVERGLGLGKEMESRNWIHGSVIQSYLFEALINQGNLPKAVEYLNKLMSKGLTPKSITYDSQIKQLCKNGEPEKASNFLNTMLKKGNAPDSASFDYLIQGYFKKQEFDMALDLHEEMLQRNLNPNMNTWRGLVIGFSEVGKITEAERLLHLMVKMGEKPSKEMYTYVMNKYHSLKNLEKAAEVMKAMQEIGYKPDFDSHWSLISNIKHLNSNKEDSNNNRNFLSGLLSRIGFSKG